MKEALCGVNTQVIQTTFVSDHTVFNCFKAVNFPENKHWHANLNKSPATSRIHFFLKDLPPKWFCSSLIFRREFPFASKARLADLSDYFVIAHAPTRTKFVQNPKFDNPMKS